MNRWWPLLWLLVLGGCATAPPGPAPSPAPPPASPSDSWTLAGRIAVHEGDQGWFAGLRWHQSPRGYRLRLQGPLGQGALELTGGPGGVTLRTADGRVSHAASPQALLKQATGVSMPVAGLRYWVRGRADPRTPASASRDSAGRLQVLRQDGWRIRYDAYTRAGGGALPSRLRLDRGNVRVRLVIDHWDPGAPAGAGSRAAPGGAS